MQGASNRPHNHEGSSFGPYMRVLQKRNTYPRDWGYGELFGVPTKHFIATVVRNTPHSTLPSEGANAFVMATAWYVLGFTGMSCNLWC